MRSVYPSGDAHYGDSSKSTYPSSPASPSTSDSRPGQMSNTTKNTAVAEISANRQGKTKMNSVHITSAATWHCRADVATWANSGSERMASGPGACRHHSRESDCA